MNNQFQNINQNENNSIENQNSQFEQNNQINSTIMVNNVQQTQEQTKKKSSKIIWIVIGIVGSIFIIIVGILLFIVINYLSASNKLVCKSKEGNITIMYNEKTIVGYTASGITYDLDGQKKIAEQIGISEYLEEFDQWFQKSTTGTCSINPKN